MATAEEKAILSKIPDRDIKGELTLDYLSKFLDGKTPEQLSHFSLDFKVAVVELLNTCAGRLERANANVAKLSGELDTIEILEFDLIESKKTLKEGIVEFERVKKGNNPNEIEAQQEFVSGAQVKVYLNEKHLKEKEDYERDLKHNAALLNKVGRYGNKMFAAISSGEIAPIEEQEAIKKNPELLLTVEQYLEEIAGRMTVDDYKERIQFCLESIAKTYGIPVPDIKVVKPGEAGFPGDPGFNPLTNADAGNNHVRLNEKDFFDKNGKFIPDNVYWLASVLCHELTHLKDFQRADSYEKSPDSEIPLFQNLANGKPDTRQDNICRLILAAKGPLEKYTKSESLQGADGEQHHNNNPLERRAILAAKTYNITVSEARDRAEDDLEAKRKGLEAPTAPTKDVPKQGGAIPVFKGSPWQNAVTKPLSWNNDGDSIPNGNKATVPGIPLTPPAPPPAAMPGLPAVAAALQVLPTAPGQT